MKIGIGIDTGGTYTDAVVYDFEARKILGAAKALTTREDLCLGITEALDGLPAELLSRASILSLSTTLATNACVEDKGGCARLVFFGGDRRVLLCAVRRSEMYELRSLVTDIDPGAFMIVVSTDEVLGEGFKNPSDKT